MANWRRRVMSSTGSPEGGASIAVSDGPELFLTIAAWFGVLTGLVEVAVLMSLDYLFHQYHWFVGPELVWLTPLADLLGFVGLGLILYPIASLLRGWASLGIAAFGFGALGFFAVLLIVPGLSLVAALILAIGLATQTSRMVVAHRERVDALIRVLNRPVDAILGLRRSSHEPKPDDRSTSNAPITRRRFLVGAGAAGVTVAGLAAVVRGGQDLIEGQTLSRLPVADRSAPNVLLIVMDTIRADHLSLFGYPRRTSPQLEQLARSGVLFTRAISIAPWTLPSHSSMFTGRYHHELSADWEVPLDARYPTLAEAFRDRGYETAGFAANVYYLCSEFGLNRGFTHYDGTTVWPGGLVNDASLTRNLIGDRARQLMGYYDDFGRKRASSVNDEFLSWFSRRDQRRPFFAFLNYFDAHHPYQPPKPFDTLFSQVRQADPRLQAWERRSDLEIQAEMAAYDDSIAYVDHEVGLLVGELGRAGYLDDTLLVVVGDHGEEFDEHGVMEHGASVYLPSIHVPLLISFPRRVPAGQIVSSSATLRDLAATVVDLAGLDVDGMFPGASLARYWDPAANRGNRNSSPLLSELNPAPWAIQNSWGPIAKGPMKSLVIEQYHYIRNGDGREELYDVEADPLETRDLVPAKQGSQLLAQFRESLEAALAIGRI